MKNLLTICLLAVLTLAACSDDNEINLVPAATGTVTDSEGNEYGWVRLGGLDWTTSNARNGAPVWNEEYYHEAYGYETSVSFYTDTLEYFNAYGNLLSYEEALVSAPEGWRLPTDDDWKSLERALGMGGEADGIGWRGDIAPLLLRSTEDALGIRLVFGGAMLYSTEGFEFGVMLKYDDEAAYYWTATVDESKTSENDGYDRVFYRKLVAGQKGVERQSTSVHLKYMAVRWVRDAQ